MGSAVWDHGIDQNIPHIQLGGTSESRILTLLSSHNPRWSHSADLLSSTQADAESVSGGLVALEEDTGEFPAKMPEHECWNRYHFRQPCDPSCDVPAQIVDDLMASLVMISVPEEQSRHYSDIRLFRVDASNCDGLAPKNLDLVVLRQRHRDCL